MSRIVEAKRMIALLAIAMAVLTVLTAALGAPDAEAKKKHRKKHRPPVSVPTLNVLQCPTESDGVTCLGTTAGDHLVGRDGALDKIQGGEGDDLYDGKGGSDGLVDRSKTSNDRYLLPSTEFGSGVRITDDGGSSDVLDLSAYRTQDFSFSRSPNTSGIDLKMDGPGNRDIVIDFFFTNDTIDAFKFSDGTLTAEFIKSNL